jgi:TetR/AcrR family transcriptional repressor of mexJK operon
MGVEVPMRTTTQTKTIRDGNAAKRATILTAARDLFVRDGVERTSMDAVAAQAGVSKRTVYDYYGDKRGLLVGVVLAAGESLLATLRRAIDEHLSDTAKIPDAAALEIALTAFATQIGQSMLASNDYEAVFKLIGENRGLLSELENHPLAEAPEEAVAERLAHFAGRGILDIDDARMAADHFNALTTLLALNNGNLARSEPSRVRRIMTDGVHVFMRAYAWR